MKRVVGNIHRLRGLIVSNVFLLDGGPGDRWLIDTAHVTERATVLFELRRFGIGPRDLTGVLLTHRHSDHAGNAAFFRKHGVAIYAHRADAEVLAGRAPRERLHRRGGAHVARFLAEFENRWPARLVVDRALDDGDTVAGLEVHWVPGHTEGSVFYLHQGTRSLLSGDTLLAARPPLALRPGLGLPYPTYSRDVVQALDSLRAFHAAGHPYDHLLSGHGPPILGDARERVLRFLDERGVSA